MDLNKQLAYLKNSGNKTQLFPDLNFNEKTIGDIQKQIYSILDSESPDTLRIFLRNYIDVIKISGNSMNIQFKVHESPDSSQDMVAGVGFEPTAFGL